MAVIIHQGDVYEIANLNWRQISDFMAEGHPPLGSDEIHHGVLPIEVGVGIAYYRVEVSDDDVHLFRLPVDGDHRVETAVLECLTREVMVKLVQRYAAMLDKAVNY